MTIITTGNGGLVQREVRQDGVIDRNKRAQQERLGRRIIVMADGTVRVGK